jgi:hypothetical protein
VNLRYLFLRLVRHFMPECLTRFLLRRSLIIRPGLETSEPASAVARYCETLAARGLSLLGKRVLVFGYGGNFAIGAELLKAGARHAVLLDRFTPPDNRRNHELVQTYPDYFVLHDGLHCKNDWTKLIPILASSVGGFLNIIAATRQPSRKACSRKTSNTSNLP